MNGIMSADFCWVPMWTPLVRYVSSGTRSPSAPIRSSSCILSLGEPLLDPDELVQLRDPFPAHGARLDSEAPEGDREMRDRVVCRLAATVGNHRRVPVAVGQIDRGLRAGQRANLVRLNKDSVGRAHLDPFPEAFHVRGEEIVPDDVACRADEGGEAGVPREVLLVQRVLPAEETVTLPDVRDAVELFVRRQGAVPIPVLAVLVELPRGEVEGGRDVQA